MNRLLVALPPSLRNRRNQLIIGWSALGVVALAAIGYGMYGYHKQIDSTASLTPVGQATVVASATPVPSASATPDLVPSALNGAMVAPAIATQRPLAVMIENHPDARPQSGLGEASVVYEAVAEGGITRFVALFNDPSQAVRVGPIRSARPYFIHFAAEYDAFFAHVGGSADAMSELAGPSSGVYNIDGLSIGAPLFARDLSRNVPIEHTMYSSTDKLFAYAQSKSWPFAASFSPLPFEDDAPMASRPASQTVKVDVSTADYNVEWDYDQASNSYKRVLAGSPHIDQNTGQQIAAKTVILQQVNSTPYTESYSGGVTKQVNDVTVTGSGPAVVFENGVATKGTWKYDGSRTRYYDVTGQEISLVRGLIWIELTYTDSTVSY